MNFPLISEYVDAIKSAEDNFDQLKNLRPILDEAGNPVMTSGNFAVVFKMEDPTTRKQYAVKCFIKEQEGRSEAYKLIEEELAAIESDYLTSFRYLDKELFVDTTQDRETEYPVLVMDWVEGVTLDKFIRDNLDDQYILRILAYRFSLLAEWLLTQPFAHGDLKPDNIIVRPGCWLTLVDYDGMYVPAMKGQKAREIGSPDFRHPSRTEETFNEYIDGFPIISILVSLKTISVDPSLFERFGTKDRLLLSSKDYQNIGNSLLLNEIYPSDDPDFNRLVALLHYSLAQQSLHGISPIVLKLTEPEYDWNYQKQWEDEFGVTYSFDGLRLISGNSHITDYQCKDGVLRIEFWGMNASLRSITLSGSTSTIGKYAFAYCENLSSIIIPESVIEIGDDAFSRCTGLTAITIPESVINIRGNPFNDCSGLKAIAVAEGNTHFDSRDECNAIIETSTNKLISGCSTTVIPNSVVSIGEEAFGYCKRLESILIPNSVISIGAKAFYNCTSLESIVIPDSVASIGNRAFSRCTGLFNVSLPNSISIIEDQAFGYCKRLESVILPNTITRIGEHAFDGCNLSSIFIPAAVSTIEDSAFENCSSISSIVVDTSNPYYDSRNGCNALVDTSSNRIIRGCVNTKIPSTVTCIGNGSFSGCRGLFSIVIPDSVTTIEEDAFSNCCDLMCINIPKSVTEIGNTRFHTNNSFWRCTKIKTISVDKDNSCFDSRQDCNAIIETKSNTLILGCGNTIIPDSISAIGDSAFYGCEGLKSIIIPNSIKHIGDYSFNACENLSTIVISNPITNLGSDVFSSSIQSIIIPSGSFNKFREMIDPIIPDSAIIEL